jgi:hypothetical protein
MNMINFKSLLIVAIFLVTACESKIEATKNDESSSKADTEGKEDSKSDSQEDSLESSDQAIVTVVAIVDGYPSDGSETSIFTIIVSGEGVLGYQFKVVSPESSSTCTEESGYEAEVTVDVQTEIDISSFPAGDVTLCVLAKGGTDKNQPLAEATVVNWNRIVIPPRDPLELVNMIQLGGSGDEYYSNLSLKGDQLVLTAYADADFSLGNSVSHTAGSGSFFLSAMSATTFVPSWIQNLGAGHTFWVGLYEPSNRDRNQWGKDIVHSGDDILLTGSTAGTVDFGGGNTSAVGAGSYDTMAGKYSSSGALDWINRFSGGTSIWTAATAIKTDSDGNVYVTGYFTGTTLDFGGGNLGYSAADDGYVAKFDSSGNHLWSISITSNGPAEPSDLILLPSSGDVFVTGVVRKSTNFGNGALANEAEKTVFTARYNGTTGAYVSADRYDQATNSGIRDETSRFAGTTSDGSAIIIGEYWESNFHVGDNANIIATTGDWDVYLGKINPDDGTQSWLKSFGGLTADKVGGGCVVDDLIYIVGSFTGSLDLSAQGLGTVTSEGGYDAYIAAFDADDGELKHIQSYGGTGDEFFQSITCNATDAYVAGHFGDSVAVDGTVYSPDGDSDLWVMRINLK